MADPINNWLPVESAPRDTDILLFFNFKGDEKRKPTKEVVKGRFYASPLWGDCWEYDGEHTVCLADNVVTHWTPLPKPPEEPING